MAQCLRRNVGCLGRLHARGAHLGGDARLEPRQGGASRVPIVGCAETGQLFQQRMHGTAQRAGEQAAFVTAVKFALPGLKSETPFDRLRAGFRQAQGRLWGTREAGFVTGVELAFPGPKIGTWGTRRFVVSHPFR